jgi:SET domain-containing protein
VPNKEDTRGEAKRSTKSKSAAPPKSSPTRKPKLSRNGEDWFVIKSSKIQGKGAFAIRKIPEGTRLVEYVGQKISPEVAWERYDDDTMDRHHTFLFTLDDDTIIDAGVRGNNARFINHSCEPNCNAVIEDGHIYVEAIKDIPRGAELLYDYKLEREGRYQKEWDELYACKCGAPTCRGTLLNRKRRKPAAAKKKSA